MPPPPEEKMATKCPKCKKVNFGVRECVNCYEPLDTKVAHWQETFPDWTGDAALYRLDPPVTLEEKELEWVVISSTFGMTGPETALFEANEDGVVFTRLDERGVPAGLKPLVTLKGRMDHREILPDYEFKMKYLDRADFAI